MADEKLIRSLTLIIFFLCFCLLIRKCRSHPQCLDYRPPFKAAGEIPFCRNDKSYGCCVASRDADIKYDFDYVMERLELSLSQECGELIKELLCLECHPYAAHIYDAERFHPDSESFEKRNVNFPGLCYNSCITFFDKCRGAIMLIARTPEFSAFIRNSTAQIFCEWAKIPDISYCYPDVKTIEHKTYERSEGSLTLCMEPLQDAFQNPLFAVAPKDGSHRLFIGEQRGLIYVLDNYRKIETPFLNITDKVINSGSPWDERGMLGFAFHPKFDINGRFFVYYSAADKQANRSAFSDFEWYWRVQHLIRVSEFVVSEEKPNIADPESELILLEIKQPEPNHNGGMLLFDNNGYLNVFVGDGGGSGDPHGTIGNGLNLTTLLGKVLRIDIDSENELYSIPHDNPFLEFPNVRKEIFAYGIRNIWRCSLDNVTNLMLCGDVGQNKYEEINVIEKGGNYGWRAFEGYSCYDSTLCEQRHKNLKPPILVYNHSIGQSVVGGYIYRGCQNPSLYGKYFYADTMNGRIFVAEHENQTWNEIDVAIGNKSVCKHPLTSTYAPHILSFGESESGEVYILTTGYPDPSLLSGNIYRLVDPYKRSDPTLCKVNKRNKNPIRKIQRRLVYYRMKGLPLPQRTDCFDRRRFFCPRFFRKGIELERCALYKVYARKFCPKSCQYC